MKGPVQAVFMGIILLAGCGRTVPCRNQFVTPAFIGFKLSDLDTLVVREYKKDDNFLTLLDTALIISDSNILSKGSSNDTTIVLLNDIVAGEGKYIFPDHDWQIYIPAQNITVAMSKFVSPQNDQKCVLGGDLCPTCSNSIDSFLQNGQQVIPQYGKISFTGGNFYLTYIHR
ncbi:MAG TPA: hypothetical protein VG890_17820 [Puia sp.]|nr:hypothetical protein [Puia sp.]